MNVACNTAGTFLWLHTVRQVCGASRCHSNNLLKPCGNISELVVLRRMSTSDAKEETMKMRTLVLRP